MNLHRSVNWGLRLLSVDIQFGLAKNGIPKPKLVFP